MAPRPACRQPADRPAAASRSVVLARTPVSAPPIQSGRAAHGAWPPGSRPYIKCAPTRTYPQHYPYGESSIARRARASGRIITMTLNVEEMIIGILGGTGDQGRGLARRFAMAGNRVIIGSRSAERARAAATEIGHGVQGMTNQDTVGDAQIVIAAVPWEGHAELLAALAPQLAGKVVVDCVNPLGFDSRGAYSLSVAEGSAAQQAAALLPHSTVVAAFHHVSAKLLLDPEVDAVDLDVLVLGDDRE